MSFLEKLDLLLAENNLNKKQFAEKSGIPYTTIDGFYKKGYENVKLSTLRKIAGFFSISLDELVFDSTDDIVLSPIEKRIIISYRNHPELQAAVNILLGFAQPPEGGEKV